MDLAGARTICITDLGSTTSSHPPSATPVQISLSLNPLFQHNSVYMNYNFARRDLPVITQRCENRKGCELANNASRSGCSRKDWATVLHLLQNMSLRQAQ